MVPQSYGIWPHMTVFDNAAFPLPVRPKDLPPPRDRSAVALAMLEQVGLSEYADRWSTAAERRPAAARGPGPRAGV